MGNEQNHVKVKFDEIARSYDQQRRKLIPCFDDFYHIAASIAEITHDTPNILDLGAGTGLFSSFLLEKYPKANVTLIDLSEKMLDVAKARFQNKQNVKFLIDDYTNYDFGESFDLVISSLSIHHLTDPEKKKLYQTIFSILKSNGLFINADQVLGSTPYLDALYKNDWKNKVENSGLTREEILSAYQRTELDRMATLQDQLSWLTEIGFADVDCVYKYYNFVVLMGRKKAAK